MTYALSALAGAVSVLLLAGFGWLFARRRAPAPAPKRTPLTDLEEADDAATDLIPDDLVGPGDDAYVADFLDRTDADPFDDAEDLDAAIDRELQDLLQE